MLIKNIAIAAAVLCCATAAQAGVVYGSSASSTFSSPIVRLSGSDADMNGDPNGSASSFRNNTRESGVATLSVSWDVTGAGSLIKWKLFIYNRTAAASITQVQLTDDLGNNATSSNVTALVTGGVPAGTITTFELTNYHAQADYGTVDAGFNWSDIRGLDITFALNSPVGTPSIRGAIQIDAIANPEPTTLALFGLGVLGLGTVVRRRRRRAAKA